MPNDKILPILLHETWPVVPSPSCLGPWTGNQEPTGFQTHDSGTYSACESVILTTTVKTLGYTHSLIAQRGRGMGPEVLGRVNWTFPILPRLLVTLKMKISKAWSLGMPSPPRGGHSPSAGKILCPLLHHLFTLFDQV